MPIAPHDVIVPVDVSGSIERSTVNEEIASAAADIKVSSMDSDEPEEAISPPDGEVTNALRSEESGSFKDNERNAGLEVSKLSVKAKDMLLHSDLIQQVATSPAQAGFGKKSDSEADAEQCEADTLKTSHSEQKVDVASKQPVAEESHSAVGTIEQPISTETLEVKAASETTESRDTGIELQATCSGVYDIALTWNQTSVSLSQRPMPFLPYESTNATKLTSILNKCM